MLAWFATIVNYHVLAYAYAADQGMAAPALDRCLCHHASSGIIFLRGTGNRGAPVGFADFKSVDGCLAVSMVGSTPIYSRQGPSLLQLAVIGCAYIGGPQAFGCYPSGEKCISSDVCIKTREPGR